MTRLHVSSTLLCAAALSLAACDSAPVVAGADVPPTQDGMVQPDAMAQPDADPPADVTDDAAMPPADGPAPRMADWGFRPDPDGFAFENYTNTPPVTNLTADDMRRMFGPVVCEGMAATGACTLIPTARTWMTSKNGDMSGGHCEGMAVLSAHFFANALMPATFGAPRTYGLVLNDNVALQREVAVWMASQWSGPQQETRTLTPRDVVDTLAREFARGRAFGGTVLGLYKNAAFEGGHAVLPYAIERVSETEAHILCYDNNKPNTVDRTRVNLTANTWEMTLGQNPGEMATVYRGDATTRTLTLIDIPSRLRLPHACSFCENAPMDGGASRNVQIAMNGEGDVRVADAMNRTTGISATGAAVSDIPGSGFRAVRSGRWDDSPEPVYDVPRATPLTITLDGSRLRAMSPTEMLITGQGWTLGLDNVNLDPMQRDTLVIQPGQPDLLYRASGVETPTLSLAFQSAADDYLIELRSASMTAGQNLRLSVDFAMNRARISFDGSTSAPMFELYVDRVSPSGDVVFEHAGVTATANAVMYVNFGAWGGDGMPMSIGYDDNGDGTIDRTAPLTDEP